MEFSRKVGIAIVCGIPAIIGAGFFWALFEKWIVVYGYLLVLGSALLIFLLLPRRSVNFSEVRQSFTEKKGDEVKEQRPANTD